MLEDLYYNTREFLRRKVLPLGLAFTMPFLSLACGKPSRNSIPPQTREKIEQTETGGLERKVAETDSEGRVSFTDNSENSILDRYMPRIRQEVKKLKEIGAWEGSVNPLEVEIIKANMDAEKSEEAVIRICCKSDSNESDYLTRIIILDQNGQEEYYYGGVEKTSDDLYLTPGLRFSEDMMVKDITGDGIAEVISPQKAVFEWREDNPHYVLIFHKDGRYEWLDVFRLANKDFIASSNKKGEIIYSGEKEEQEARELFDSLSRIYRGEIESLSEKNILITNRNIR